MTQVQPNVLMDSLSAFVTFDFRGRPLADAAKDITAATSQNIILSPGLESTQISGYILNMPLQDALEKLAFANGLSMHKTDNGFYVLTKATSGEIIENSGKRTRIRNIDQTRDGSFQLETNAPSFDSLEVFAVNAPIELIVKEISDMLGINYYFTSPIQGTISLNVSGTSYPEFLQQVLNGTSAWYVKKENIYLFGNNATNGLREYKILKLQYRTVPKLLDLIPESLKAGMELKEFPEMNSILVGGSTARVNDFEALIGQIDKTIPVILIEVMIVYLNDSYNITTGIEAGISEEPVTTKGTVYPGVDMQFGSETINNLLNSFNGFGTLKIGKVTPNFYLNLKALESQGIIHISSTPQLATLNGHDASLSIGNTEYYLEQRTDLFGAQNPQLTTTNTYQSVEAELSVVIKPIVAGDDQITLEIEVNQSDFTERITKYAPPGKMSRKFKSMIRVRDQEMILLGGLEEKKKTDTAAGVPLLSRIPVLKWIFSSRSKEKTNSKLSLFIKPTVIN
jgi:type IV pilus assembly protein PilQ